MFLAWRYAPISPFSGLNWAHDVLEVILEYFSNDWFFHVGSWARAIFLGDFSLPGYGAGMNSWCLFCHLALWDHLIFSSFGSQGGFNYSVTLGISGCFHWTWSSIGTLLSFWKCWLSSQDYFRFFIISFSYFYFNFFLLFFFSFSNSFFWFFHLSKTTFSWSTKFLSWVTPCVWAQEKQQQTEDTFAPYLWPTKEEVSPVLLILMGNRKTKGGPFL